MRGLSRPRRDYGVVSSVDYVEGVISVTRERFWQREVREQLREERWTGPKDSWTGLMIS